MMKIRTILIAILTSILSFYIQANEAFPQGTCKRWDHVDYQRKCGEVPNVNSLLHLRQKDDCAIIEINAKSHWNASGILFEKDVPYTIEVIDGKNAKWKDTSIETTADGWCLPPKANKANEAKCEGTGDKALDWVIGLLERFRRAPGHDWFYLMGAVVAGDKKPLDNTMEFDIGVETKEPIIPPIEGEFCSFANDLSWTYYNNRGTLELQITRQ
jgi:hypothetical protein